MQIRILSKEGCMIMIFVERIKKLIGKNVYVGLDDGCLEGKLYSIDEDFITLGSDGNPYYIKIKKIVCISEI